MIGITFTHVLVDCVDWDVVTSGFYGCTREILGLYTRVGDVYGKCSILST